MSSISRSLAFTTSLVVLCLISMFSFGCSATTKRATAAARETSKPAKPGGSDFATIDTAIGDHDLCGVVDALDDLRLPSASTREFIEQLTEIHRVLVDASDIVDPEIVDEWDTVTASTAEAIDQLQSGAEGDDFAPGDGYERASHEIDAWMVEHCG